MSSSGPSYKWFLFSLYFPECVTISSINMSSQFSIQKKSKSRQTIHFFKCIPYFCHLGDTTIHPHKLATSQQVLVFHEALQQNQQQTGQMGRTPQLQLIRRHPPPSSVWAFSTRMQLLSPVNITNFWHFIKSKSSFSEDKSCHYNVSCRPGRAQHIVGPCS